MKMNKLPTQSRQIHAMVDAFRAEVDSAKDNRDISRANIKWEQAEIRIANGEEIDKVRLSLWPEDE